MNIVESPSGIRFALEAVLTPKHPRYEAPAADEQHFYVAGELVFSEVLGVEWLERSVRKYNDATGVEDLGSIDSLTSSDGVYLMIGDWGKVQICTSADPEFRISESD